MNAIEVKHRLQAQVYYHSIYLALKDNMNRIELIPFINCFD